MSTPPAGTTKKRMFSRNDYLAPLPIPTGRKPSDVLNIIWRKNEAFLDVGNYSIGSAVMVMWPTMMVFLAISPGVRIVVASPVFPKKAYRGRKETGRAVLFT
ncbi:hypothetical protein ACIOWA_27830, partial [Pseudomonas sp. NPDC087614]